LDGVGAAGRRSLTFLGEAAHTARVATGRAPSTKGTFEETIALATEIAVGAQLTGRTIPIGACPGP